MSAWVLDDQALFFGDFFKRIFTIFRGITEECQIINRLCFPCVALFFPRIGMPFTNLAWHCPPPLRIWDIGRHGPRGLVGHLLGHAVFLFRSANTLSSKSQRCQVNHTHSPIHKKFTACMFGLLMVCVSTIVRGELAVPGQCSSPSYSSAGSESATKTSMNSLEKKTKWW